MSIEYFIDASMLLRRYCQHKLEIEKINTLFVIPLKNDLCDDIHINNLINDAANNLCKIITYKDAHVKIKLSEISKNDTVINADIITGIKQYSQKNRIYRSNTEILQY